MNYLGLGRVGHCKSLDMAITIYKCCVQSEKIQKKYDLPKREILVNSPMSKEIMKRFEDRLIYYECLMDAIYVDHPKNKIKRKNFDLFIDEIGDIIPSDHYKDLPIDVRRFFSQHRHRGVRIFSWSQSYMKVDINYRRMLTKVYELKKLIGSRDPDVTKPPLKVIWGYGAKWELDLELLSGNTEIKKHKGILPEFIPINKKWVKMYDMTYDIEVNKNIKEPTKCGFCNEEIITVNN